MRRVSLLFPFFVIDIAAAIRSFADLRSFMQISAMASYMSSSSRRYTQPSDIMESLVLSRHSLASSRWDVSSRHIPSTSPVSTVPS
jgi:hypothetical protein